MAFSHKTKTLRRESFLDEFEGRAIVRVHGRAFPQMEIEDQSFQCAFGMMADLLFEFFEMF